MEPRPHEEAGEAPTHGRVRHAIGRALGQELRLARDRAELTVRELGERAGISPGYVRKLEAGKSAPSTVVAGDLVDALELEADHPLAADLRAAAVPDAGKAHPLAKATTRRPSPRPARPPAPTATEIALADLDRLAEALERGALDQPGPHRRRILRRLRTLADAVEQLPHAEPLQPGRGLNEMASAAATPWNPPRATARRGLSQPPRGSSAGG